MKNTIARTTTKALIATKKEQKRHVLELSHNLEEKNKEIEDKKIEIENKDKEITNLKTKMWKLQSVLLIIHSLNFDLKMTQSQAS